MSGEADIVRTPNLAANHAPEIAAMTATASNAALIDTKEVRARSSGAVATIGAGGSGSPPSRVNLCVKFGAYPPLGMEITTDSD